MGLKKFFDDWNHQYQLEIIAVYHNVQNEKKHMSKSRDIEFGDKNNLETGPKWAQFGPNYFLGCCNHLHQLNIINF